MSPVTRIRHVGALTCAALATAALAGCRDGDRVTAAAASHASDSSAAAVRDAALARAKVWRPPRVDPGAVDFSTNTPAADAFDASADVDCTFVVQPVGGTTPKFVCALPDGERIKVKYGAPNGELPAEVAGTRLLDALGFFADRMNRVHSVRCRGCPLLPQQALQCLAKGEPAAVCLQGATTAAIVTFSPAVIERPIEGHKIEASEDQGWSWYELERIDPKAGGSSRAEVDALRLVAVLIAHWDNKGANQKLICPPGADRADGRCTSPVAAIGDLGATFGPTKVDLLHWKALPVWADARACRLSMKTLPYGGATFPDRSISEDGRRLALRLLGALTRDQLNTLFEASGVTAFPHVAAAARQPQAWTDAFLDKVEQIRAAGPCQGPESRIPNH
jgi:hypothetical protein